MKTCSVCDATPGTGADPIMTFKGRMLCAVCMYNAQRAVGSWTWWGFVRRAMLFVIGAMAVLFSFAYS